MKTLLFLTSLVVSLYAQAASLSYESCETGVNDYMDRELAGLNTTDVLRSSPNSKECTNSFNMPSIEGLSFVPQIENTAKDLSNNFPLSCVVESMKNAPQATQGYHYGVCSSPQQAKASVNYFVGKKKQLVEKPCVSQAYSSYVYNSFMKSMNCLGLDPKEMFPLFGHESGFQTNIGNVHGNWGVGQLTPSGFRRMDWPKETEHLLPKPECASVQPELLHGMSPKVTSCERISLPENPTRNFLYGGVLYMQYKAMAEKVVARMQKRRGKHALPPKEAEKLAIELARKMYNAGPSVISNFKAYLQEGHADQGSRQQISDSFNRWLPGNFGSAVEAYQKDKTLLDRMRVSVVNYSKMVSQYVQKLKDGDACGE